MSITFGDYLIDSGYYDPPEEERMNLDYEIELRRELRSGRRVHILTTDEGMIIAHGYPYHGDRFVRVPESLETAILEMCADPSLSSQQHQTQGE